METTKAVPKTIGKADIEAAANKANMAISEFVEWGMHALIETFSNSENSPGDAKADMPTLRGLRGGVAPGVIRKSPLEAFAEAEGMTMNEMAEAAILTAMDLIYGSEYPDKTPCDILQDYRRNRRLLLPEIGKGSEPQAAPAPEIHPFMHRLFSGNLRALHGADFGDRGSESVNDEHQFLEQSLTRAFSLKSWDEVICELMVMESVIRHCPALKNEAAALRSLIEAEKVLGDFCRAVDAA